MKQRPISHSEKRFVQTRRFVFPTENMLLFVATLSLPLSRRDEIQSLNRQYDQESSDTLFEPFHFLKLNAVSQKTKRNKKIRQLTKVKRTNFSVCS